MQIETQANSVQVVLEPGRVDAPIVEHREENDSKNDNKNENKGKVRKIIKVVNPIYMGGLRRNMINKRGGKHNNNNDKTKRAVQAGKKTFVNSIMLEKWRKENEQIISKNSKRIHNLKRRSLAKMRKYKKENVKSKKSEVGREMRVHGRTGGFHVMTGKKGTKLVSKGGALNVFIRNPDEPQNSKNEDSNSDRRSPQDDSQYHVINSSLNGLSLRRSVGHRKKKGCAIPPCSL